MPVNVHQSTGVLFEIFVVRTHLDEFITILPFFFYTGDNYPGKFCRNDPRSRSVMHKIQITQYDEPQPGRAIGIPVANQAAKNKLPAVL